MSSFNQAKTKGTMIKHILIHGLKYALIVLITMVSMCFMITCVSALILWDGTLFSNFITAITEHGILNPHFFIVIGCFGLVMGVGHWLVYKKK